jgi:septum formation inhibitor-activating ATPase MinD
MMIVSSVRDEETVMGSLLERLEQREQAARGRVEALRAEMERLAEHLAAEEQLLSRLQITRQTVIEVLAGDELPTEDGVVSDPEAGAGAASSRVGVQVPVVGRDGDGRRLPVAYRDVVEVLAAAGVPLRARQVCQAGVPGGGDRRRAQASGGDADQAQAAGGARLAGGGRAGAVCLRWGRG